MEAAVTVYELECVDCGFETTVVGDFQSVLAAIQEHREALDAGPDEHFVNVHQEG